MHIVAEQENSGAATYDKLVGNGHYERDTGGLTGKHDNVRSYWEDELTRQFLRPILRQIMDHAYWTNGERVRVFDLGCGSGQGYDLITSVTAKDPDVYEHATELLPSHLVGRYVGCDISEEMICQAQETYGNTGKFEFQVADFGKGLPVAPEDQPFHLYFSSYGSLSHIGTEQLTTLLAEIAGHARPRAFVILDLLGRYSYEWPCYWDRPATEGNDMWEYSMSYLPGEDPQRCQHWPMRYWSVEEVQAAVVKAAEASPQDLRIVKSFDRSIFVGRHIDTGEYNPVAPGLRRVVNQLHEPNIRTDIGELLIDFVPQGNNQKLNAFFENFHVAWNTLVHFCLDKLATPEGGKNLLKNSEKLRPPVKLGIQTIDRVVDNVGWMEMGDARANIIEPQLGYALRGLEAAMQPGAGFGHGLLVAIEVVEQS